jgi:hypothetical protein
MKRRTELIIKSLKSLQASGSPLPVSFMVM